MTLTDKQKQDIKQEAEKYWPAAVAFGEKARRAYIAGATARALACIQKDEEIGRLTGLLNLAAQKLVAAQTALMNIRDFESHNEAWEDVVDMKLIAEKYFNINHP